MKPSIFIGSSKEALKIAYAIQENLSNDALCRVWTQGIFTLSGSALDNLLEAVKKVDYAIFIFQADDITYIRNTANKTARDNVIFEMGLFIGALGKKRVFYLVSKDSDDIHLPTDLIGMEPGHYNLAEKDEDILPALGPFCNKVRRQITTSSQSHESQSLSSSLKDEGEAIKDTNTSEVEQQERPELKQIEPGVKVDQFGNYTIYCSPAVFWDQRISSAFPGIRGIRFFNAKNEIITRLCTLLKTPLKFVSNIGDNTVNSPLWWWRGGSDLYIENFSQLDENHCLMDIYELNVDKIAVYRGRSYWSSFVYVETEPDKQTDLYHIDDDTIQEHIKTFGYSWEEYAKFNGTYISRESYDDGAAFIDGKIYDTSGAELRVRYLSKYNFIIAPQFSPFNSVELDKKLEDLLNQILLGQNLFDEICLLVQEQKRHRLDF